jgi:glycosyltransferase involved in cell wall biosynthesis
MRFVIDSRYIRRRPSGIGTCVEALVERLPALAPQYRFHAWTHPERPEPFSAPNLSCTVVGATADGLGTLLWPARLAPLAADDVAHFPCSLLGRGIPCATVVTINDLMWLEQPELVDARPLWRRLRQSYYQLGMRWAIQQATRIITISQATADRVIARVPEASRKVRVTPLAVSRSFRVAADQNMATSRAAALIGSNAPFYLVVGKNEPYKGHELALAAFAEGAAPDELLVMVQRTSSGRGLARRASELGIRDRVLWLPDLALPDLITLLQAARALLQPSLVEGFGLPALEAINCGCPVIASDTPALVEVLAGAGLHAAVGSAAALAREIRRMQDDTLRLELVARGTERARAFDWDLTAKATLAVYEEAAAAGAGSSR